MEIKNAKITDTMLGREDHGILTFMIYFEGDGFGVGVGGYALDSYNKELNRRVTTPKSMDAISEILNVVGVETWEQLKGKYIRFVDNGWGSKVTIIGNILEDKWFDFKEFFANNDN